MVKKNIAIIIFLCSVCCLSITAIKNKLFKQKDIHIAVVSMGGEHKRIGHDMLSGINLYINTLNKNGGVNGRKVNLDIYDDKGDRNVAIKVAMEIARQNRALLVIGHYFSSASLGASNIYFKKRMPAITGSATAENITQKNEWYFSTIPNNIFHSEFIASYIRLSLGLSKCSIIYDSDDYGTSLYKSFKAKAETLKLDIKYTFHFDKNNEFFSHQVKRIISQLRLSSDPGIIFLATHAKEGIRFITSLKYPGSTYQIIGPDSFSINEFIHRLSKRSKEKSYPGCYSDNIFTITPFLSDFVNNHNQKFISDYMRIYKQKPSWVSACYYDAVHMAIAAIKETEGIGTIKQNRMMIRNVLAEKNSIHNAEKGVTGLLFFDQDRNVKYPLHVCLYKNQNLVPDYFQYDLLTSSSETMENDNIEKSKNRKQNSKSVINKTRIVFTGNHINKISNFDMNSGTYDMDFFLWFRFKGPFDESNIQFLNAVNPIKLNKIFVEYIDNTIITRVYHLKGKFYSSMDLRPFPFETHKLGIQFRHQNDTSDRLVYVADTKNELKYNKVLYIDKQSATQLMPAWKISHMKTYNSIISYESNPDIPLEYQLTPPVQYSTCTSVVEIRRKNLQFAIKTLCPSFAFLLLLIVAIFIPLRMIKLFIVMQVSVFMMSFLFLMKTFSIFNITSFIFIQYMYFALSFSTFTGLVILIPMIFIKHKTKYKNTLYLVSRALIFLTCMGIIQYAYFNLDSSNHLESMIVDVIKTE